jgi:hypothetical protein
MRIRAKKQPYNTVEFIHLSVWLLQWEFIMTNKKENIMNSPLLITKTNYHSRKSIMPFTQSQPQETQCSESAQNSDIINHPQRKRPRLIAQWHTVNDKLICRWISLET